MQATSTYGGGITSCANNNCKCKSCLRKKILPTLLEEIMLELELDIKLDGTPLTTAQKDAYRGQARRGRDKIQKWITRCQQLSGPGKKCHIHHIIPLQHIHQFKGRNPNVKQNVLLLSPQQHHKIHRDLRAHLAEWVPKIGMKNALQSFYRRIRKKDSGYHSAKIPTSYKPSVLKEILQELNL